MAAGVNTQKNAALFASAARALWGDAWVAPASAALRLNLRTMQRVAKAVREDRAIWINDGWLRDLAMMLDAHAVVMTTTARALRSQVNVRSPVATSPIAAPPRVGLSTLATPPLAVDGGAPMKPAGREN